MSGESDFIELMRQMAHDPAARGLVDDAAILPIGNETLVLTHDMIVEGVHYLSTDPPEDVAWKLVAVNLSDLAAKGAEPIGVLLGHMLGSDDARFVEGLATALTAFAMPLLGGDTVALPAGAPRVLGLTAIGRAAGRVPSRAGAKPGDQLWVSGTIGDAGAGLALLQQDRHEPAALIERYRNPRPRLDAGEFLAPIVTAMMDLSDGLLIDAARMAAASGCAIEIALHDLPLSAAYLALKGPGRESRLAAATAGDDYELLFAAAPEQAAAILALADEIVLPLSPIGRIGEGSGLTLADADGPIALPEQLGFEHER